MRRAVASGGPSAEIWGGGRTDDLVEVLIGDSNPDSSSLLPLLYILREKQVRRRLKVHNHSTYKSSRIFPSRLS